MNFLHKIYTFLMDTILIELIKIYRHEIQQLKNQQSPTAAALKY